MILRGYQINGVDGIRAALLEKFKAILYILATGGGKTPVFLYIGTKAAERGHRVMILTHRKELLNQASRSLDFFGAEHGLIAAGRYMTDDLIQVASVQTLVRRLDIIEPPKIIIVDEAHHSRAATWDKIFKAFPDAIVIGVTATPSLTSGVGLGVKAGGIYDKMILGPSVRTLTDEGYLSRPKLFGPEEKIDLKDVHSRMGDYVQDEIEKRVNKPTITGHAVEQYKKICPGVPAIVFCITIKHAQDVAEEFRAAGYRAEHIDGNLDGNVRDQRIENLGNGRLHVLTSCEIVSEGTDIPVCTVAILLRPTESMRLYLQQIGRIGRPVYTEGYNLATKEGRLAAIAAGPKPHSIILDHVGNWERHGMPLDEREWSLEGRKRTNRGKKEQEQMLLNHQCERCGFVFSARSIKCPECGYINDEIPLPKQVEGDLFEIDEEQAEFILRQKENEKAEAKRRVNIMINTATSLDEMYDVAKQLGYKREWARIRWNLKRRRRAPKLVR
jgi:superfamily II DNA or RNA helicase